MERKKTLPIFGERARVEVAKKGREDRRKGRDGELGRLQSGKERRSCEEKKEERMCCHVRASESTKVRRKENFSPTPESSTENFCAKCVQERKGPFPSFLLSPDQEKVAESAHAFK